MKILPPSLSKHQGEYGKLVKHVLSLGDESQQKRQPGDGSAAVPDALLRLPDVFVGYNMGLTVPEYEGWGHTLVAMRR